ncbi:Crp/Fnr family transcriptional regulator [soil metagenome]
MGIGSTSIGLEGALEHLARLLPADAHELSVIRAQAPRTLLHPVNADLSEPSHGGHSMKILVEGWAMRTKSLTDGRRQVISVLIPGDIVSQRQTAPGWGLTTVTAITPVRTLEAADLCNALRQETGRPSWLARACSAAAASEDNLVLEHIVRLGLRDASERTAHLLLELRNRLDTVGLCSDDRFAFPLKQELLGEALGMSVVHVNRTLQGLRKAGIFELHGGQVAVLQPELAAKLAQIRI